MERKERKIIKELLSKITVSRTVDSKMRQSFSVTLTLNQKDIDKIMCSDATDAEITEATNEVCRVILDQFNDEDSFINEKVNGMLDTLISDEI